MGNLQSLVEQAWELRKKNYPPVLTVAAPGAKHYDNKFYRNRSSSFVNISITGHHCALQCSHCRGKLLETMITAENPAAMQKLIDNLIKTGCQGILVSGGADQQGQVPLAPFLNEIAYAHDKGMKVLVHTGLVTRTMAERLAEAGVDQILIDVIGDEGTIKNVYHIDRNPDDYLRAMQICREEGLTVVPHVVLGLDYGQIKGEIRALQMIKNIEPEVVVLVVIMPMSGTDMASVQPPQLDKAAEVIATARLMNPSAELSLGCARPTGEYKRHLEIKAVDCGVNKMAYPDETTLEYAASRGLDLVFTENCCSMPG